MKNLAIFAALSLASTAAAATPTVVTAKGDWNYLPTLKSGDYAHFDVAATQRIYDLANSGRCQIPGYRANGLKFRLSFAVQYNAFGALDRVILPPMNCPQAEGILGDVLIKMITGGDYKRVPADSDGWYRGDLAFDYNY